jgi:Tfp pilus assembly protein PilV
MKLATLANKNRTGAFTLAEVLAALLFLAIVIPAAVEALHVASLSGEVAARKGMAARVADRILNESIIMTNWNPAAHKTEQWPKASSNSAGRWPARPGRRIRWNC